MQDSLPQGLTDFALPTSYPSRMSKNSCSGALALSSILGIASLCGCDGATTYSTAATRSNVDLQRRISRDQGLSSDLVMESAIVTESGGVTFAQVTLTNRGQTTRSVHWRFNYLNESGLDITPGNARPWSTTIINAGEMTSLSGTMPADAMDFRFAVKMAPR